MTIRRYLLRCLALLILIGPVPAGGQRVPAREAFRRYAPHAVKELGRGLSPADQNKVHEAVSRSLAGWYPNKNAADSVADRMKLVADGLKRVDLEFKVNGQTPRREMTFAPVELRDRTSSSTKSAEDIFARAVNSVVRRDDIIESVHAQVVRELEGRSSPDRIKSDLETFLERDLKLKDHTAVAESFDPNVKVKLVELQQPTTLLRLFGGDSLPLGRYLFCCLVTPFAPPLQFLGSYERWTDASGLATPPENSHSDLAIVHLPAGTRILIGTVADNFPDKDGQYSLGGNTQMFLPTVSDFPYERYRLHRGNTGPRDVIVVFDNGRVGRFRPPA